MQPWLTALLAGVLAVLARDITKDLYGLAKTNWRRIRGYLWLGISASGLLYLALMFRPSDPIRPHDLYGAITAVIFICLGACGAILHLLDRVITLLIKHEDTMLGAMSLLEPPPKERLRDSHEEPPNK